jgi:hypothetical protein
VNRAAGVFVSNLESSVGLNVWHDYTESAKFPEWRLFTVAKPDSGKQLMIRLTNQIPSGVLLSRAWAVSCEPLSYRRDFHADTLEIAQTEAVRLVTEYARQLVAWVEICLAAQPGYPARPPTPEPPPAPPPAQPLAVAERSLWAALGFMRQAYGTLWAISDEKNYKSEIESAVSDARRANVLLDSLVPLAPADTRVSTEGKS